MIDLRSATCRRPIPEMRAAMASAAARGVYMLPPGPSAVRVVFYLDVTSDEAEHALAIIIVALRVLPARADAARGARLCVAPSNTAY
jgi:threonine aldolase